MALTPFEVSKFLSGDEMQRLMEAVVRQFDQEFSVLSVRSLQDKKWVQVKLANGLMKTVVV